MVEGNSCLECIIPHHLPIQFSVQPQTTTTPPPPSPPTSLPSRCNTHTEAHSKILLLVISANLIRIKTPFFLFSSLLFPPPPPPHLRVYNSTPYSQLYTPTTTAPASNPLSVRPFAQRRRNPLGIHKTLHKKRTGRFKLFFFLSFFLPFRASIFQHYAACAWGKR